MNPNRVRIIAGRLRGRRIHFAPSPDLRPSPDRVRETLFNWLGQDLTGFACLDLFAGSGALGFEAVSRGARRVVMVERAARVWARLRENVALLGCEDVVTLRRADALEFVAACDRAFDVVFLDPPFASDLLAALRPALPRLVRPGGLLYVESAGAFALDPPWERYRSAVAGQVSYQLFRHGHQ